MPLACAILTFLYFNWQGIRHHGLVKYVAHFAGPVPWLAPLIFPVEIISTSARILSLTVRLWANILASDLIYSIFLGLFVSLSTWGWAKTPVLGVVLAVLPATLPIAFIGLHVFVAIVQALATTYLWPNYGDAYPFVILVVVLAVRPQGLVRMVTGVRY